MSTRETLVPAIPDVREDNVQEVLRAIKNVLEVREGNRGDPLDQSVTLRDLTDLTILKSGTTTLTNGTRVPVISYNVNDDGYDPVTDLTTPAQPTNLVITSGFASIFLTWDGAPYKNPAYTEIWRASTNNLGSAVRIGTTITNVYSDAVGKTSQTYYYWIRFVSVADVVGPYNSTNGTLGSTSLVGGVDLGPLIVTADKIATGAIDLGGAKVTGLLANTNLAVISDPTKIADSLIGNTKLADLAVDAAKLANSSVTATKIANLAVGTAAIQTGAITTALIANAAVGSAQIANAAITEAKIGNLAVGNAAIQNAAITNAKIADLAADKITTGNLVAGIGITTGYISSGITPGMYPPGHAFFGTGYYLGPFGGAQQLYIGSYATNMLWNGTDLSIRGTVQASNAVFKGLTIQDSSGNVMLASGNINGSYITGLGAGQISGLGGLATENNVFVGSTVRFADGTVMNTGDFVNRLSQINSGNISTFIASGAIGNAYIGNAAISSAKIQDAAITSAKIENAAITNAKIGYAEVDTLKLAGDSVTIHESSYLVGYGSGSVIVDFNVYMAYAGSITLIVMCNEINMTIPSNFTADWYLKALVPGSGGLYLGLDSDQGSGGTIAVRSTLRGVRNVADGYTTFRLENNFANYGLNGSPGAEFRILILKRYR